MSGPQHLDVDNHPKVTKAMRLYDEYLTDDEKRTLYRTAVIAAVSAEQENYYGNRLTLWAGGVTTFIAMHSHPEIQAEIRAAKAQLEAGIRQGGGPR